MSPIDVIVIVLIVSIISLATFYIVRAKTKGKKCIGCPYSDSCSGGAVGCSCSCSKERDNEDEK